jgi:GTP-binding protein EngB required for normal cell division
MDVFTASLITFTESSHTVDGEESSATHHILNDEYRTMINDIAQIQELRDIGIESRSLPLPKICVVGDQNVGKSSVIEAISGIKVPRGESTTTRCPMEINLRRAEANAGWKCKVSLVHKYMYIEDTPGRHGKKAASGGLGPWREQQPQKTVHFCDLDNKEDVPNVLKWAQVAILNPKTDPKRYIPVRSQTVFPPEQLQVGFSPNLVRLDISAPHQENLSFYDLPGIIVNSEDQQLIEVVKYLVREYIRDKTCIILLTFSIIEDPMNSNAFKLVRSVQGADKRTRGVFTKADMLQIEPMGASKPTWIEMLEEKRFQLGLGYGVVMNDPRKKEEDFFGTEQPWCTSLLRFKDSFGSANLQSALSKLLNEQIRAYLPQIIQKITARIQETDEELHELPEAPNNDEVMRVLEKMFHFNNELRTQFEGGSPDHPFQKAYRIRAQKFQQTLLQSRPTLQPLSKKEQECRNQLQKANAARAGSRAESPITPRHGVIDLDSDNDEPAKFQVKAPQGTRRTFNEAFSPTPASDSSSRGKRQKTEGQGNKAPPGKQQCSPSPVEFRLTVTVGKKFSLDEIREINRDAQGAGLTTPCATKAIERMNRHSVKHWEELMEQFLADTEKLLKEMVVVEYDKVLGKYRDTPLYKEGGDIIRAYLASAVREQREYAKRAFNIECLTPFTMNDLELKKGKQNALAKLEELRMQYRKILHVDYEEMRHGRGPSTGEERVKALKKIGPVEMGPDEFTNEIETMAVRPPLPLQFRLLTLYLGCPWLLRLGLL